MSGAIKWGHHHWLKRIWTVIACEVHILKILSVNQSYLIELVRLLASIVLPAFYLYRVGLSVDAIVLPVLVLDLGL